MRPLRYSINVTLDGCCDHRAIPADEDLHRHAAENIEQADALLFGRVTYEMMEAAWRRPAETGVRPDWMADWMEPFARTIDKPNLEVRVARTDVYVLVFDGFADWEPALALAELRRSGKRNVVVVGFNNNPVISMGGLRILPDRLLADVTADQIGLLVLPGGDLWEFANYPQPSLSALLRQLDADSIPIAAICGATLALARAGLLNDRRHTSTVPGDLNTIPGYSGAAYYVRHPAVTDRGVITASGLANVEFAREVLSMLGVFSRADEVLWFDMYKSGRLPSTGV